jgi:hypothetical protein
MVSLNVLAVWQYLRGCVHARFGPGGRSDCGSVVEVVILTAVFAALAIAVGIIITTKVTQKAKSINLN